MHDDVAQEKTFMWKCKNFYDLAAAALLIGCSLFLRPAQAAYIVTLEEVGSDVVATGSGTIDTTDLAFVVTGNVLGAQTDPSEGLVITGPVGLGSISAYTGLTGPANFGSGDEILANSGARDLVGVSLVQDLLIVPMGYVSGGALSDTGTYDGATFPSLGVTPGTYTWTWGSGADADSFMLNVDAAPVPEPNTLSLLGAAALFGLLLASRRRQRPPATIVEAAVAGNGVA